MESGKLASLHFFLLIFMVTNASAESPFTNSLQQDTARQQETIQVQKKRLEESIPKINSSLQSDGVYNIDTVELPTEQVCWTVHSIFLENYRKLKNISTLKKALTEFKERCVGIDGIQVLKRTIQNELVTLGYITTRLTIPDQDLSSGVLKFNLIPGIIDKISLSPESQSVWLVNTLPFKPGDVISLKDLERGSENLQRVNNSASQLLLYPASDLGETDIVVDYRQEKKWRLGLWLDDSGNKNINPYQNGAFGFLNNMLLMNDIFSASVSGNAPFASKNNTNNSSHSLFYSVPVHYWDSETFYSSSASKQALHGNYSTLDYKTNYQYFSQTFRRLLNRTREKRMSASIQVFLNKSWSKLAGYELDIQKKISSGWKLSLENDYYFSRGSAHSFFSFQNKQHWFGRPPEEKIGNITPRARIVTFGASGDINFSATDQQFTYSPSFSAQITPDSLSTLDKFYIGNRWSVRGFDGQMNLSRNSGWYLQNEIKWTSLPPAVVPYAGIDIGQVNGCSHNERCYQTLVGSVAGVRGNISSLQYHLFIGTPLAKPASMRSEKLTTGFSSQWQY